MGKLLRKKEREKGKGKKNEAQLCARHHHQHTLARSATTQPITAAMTRPRRCHACCHGDSRAHATEGLRSEGNQAGGWEKRPGNTGGEHTDIELIATNKAKNQRQFSKYYTTMVWLNEFLPTYSILRRAKSPKYQVDKIYRHCSKNIKH